MKNFRLHIIFASLIFIDQITKLIFSARDFFLGPIRIHPVKNYALAFSLDFGQVINFTLIAAALSFFLYYFFKNRQQFNFIQKVGTILIFSGALSNIFDRLYLGYVRDFLDIGLGSTFNLADVFVLFGLMIIFLLPWNGDKSSI